MYRNRYLLGELTKRDFKGYYINSILGLLWAVLEPLAMMMILWFVFEVGLRAGKRMEIPFVTYLITGIAGYNYFSKGLGTGTNVMRGYSFLVSKVKVRLYLLPIVKLLSNLLLHCINMVIALIILAANGIYPTVYAIQIVYYIFGLSLLLLGLTYLTSAISVFVPDITNIVNIVTRFLFFLTPIMFSMDMVPQRFHLLFKLNPLFFIVQGYRDSLIYRVGFWSYPVQNAYYWGVVIVFFTAGVLVFRKLEPYFAEVL